MDDNDYTPIIEEVEQKHNMGWEELLDLAEQIKEYVKKQKKFYYNTERNK